MKLSEMDDFVVSLKLAISLNDIHEHRATLSRRARHFKELDAKREALEKAWAEFREAAEVVIGREQSKMTKKFFVKPR